MECSGEHSAPALSGRNLVVLSDGTGNRGGKSHSTNVWRLFQTLNLHDAPVPQLAIYDDGVGTEDFRPLKLLGGAFGWGLTANVVELYSFLARHYRPGDRIYLFGFSRGAFTVRVLAGLIHRCGLWSRDALLQHPDPERFMRKRIVRAYRSLSDDEVARLQAETALLRDVRIRFVGVWDTVDAVGMPIDELKFPLEAGPRLLLGRRGYGFHDRQLADTVISARQALSLDDDRGTFHPNVWSTPHPRGNRQGLCMDLDQVWFAGAHSNVGGGYPKDALAHVSLDWMLGECDALGADRLWLYGDSTRPTADVAATQPPVHAHLTDDRGHDWTIISPARTAFQQRAHAHGRQYQPRAGAGLFYRHRPRNPMALYQGRGNCWRRLGQRLSLSEGLRQKLNLPARTCAPRALPVHISVLDRLRDAPQHYATQVLPEAIEWRSTHGHSPYARTPAADAPTAPPPEIAPALRHWTRRRQAGWGAGMSGALLLVPLLLPLLGTALPPLASVNAWLAQTPFWYPHVADFSAAGQWLFQSWGAVGLALLTVGVGLSLQARNLLQRRSLRAWLGALTPPDA